MYKMLMMSGISKSVDENEIKEFYYNTKPDSQLKTIFSGTDWNGTKICWEIEMEVNGWETNDQNRLKFVYDRISADIRRKMIARLSQRETMRGEKRVNAAMCYTEVMKYLDKLYVTSRTISLTEFVEQCRYGKEKSALQYFERIMHLSQSCPGVSVDMAVRQVVLNLPERIRKFLPAGEFNNEEDFIKVLNDAENEEKSRAACYGRRNVVDEVRTYQQLPDKINKPRLPISKKEYERRKMNRLCLKCGKSGHYLRNCSEEMWKSHYDSSKEGRKEYFI